MEENDNKTFGNITQIFITILSEKKVDIEKIRVTVSNGFGVEIKNIDIRIES